MYEKRVEVAQGGTFAPDRAVLNGPVLQRLGALWRPRGLAALRFVVSSAGSIVEAGSADSMRATRVAPSRLTGSPRPSKHTSRMHVLLRRAATSAAGLGCDILPHGW